MQLNREGSKMCTEGEKQCLACCGTVFRKAVEPVQSGKFSSGKLISPLHIYSHRRAMV